MYYIYSCNIVLKLKSRNKREVLLEVNDIKTFLPLPERHTYNVKKSHIKFN